MYICMYVFIYICMCVEVWGQPLRVGSLFYYGGSKKAWSKHFYPLSHSEGLAGLSDCSDSFLCSMLLPRPLTLHSGPCAVYGRPHFFGSLCMASWCRVLYILCLFGLPGRAVPRSTELAGNQPSSSEHSPLNGPGSVVPVWMGLASIEVCRNLGIPGASFMLANFFQAVWP